MRYDHGSVSLRSALVLASVASGLVLAPRAASGQACSQLRSLLPGSPAHVYDAPPFKNQPGKGCIAMYWIRVATMSKIGGLYEFGAQVAIWQEASPAAAKQKVLKAGNPVAYGDGGFERIELPGANDLPTPTREDVAAGGMVSVASGLSDLFEDAGEYRGSFSCGTHVVTVFANPSKGVAARQLIAELAANLRSQIQCGSAAATSTAPVAPPVTPPVTPQTDDEPGTGGGTRHFDGRTAEEIRRALAGGSRYMVVLSRTWDPAQNCFIEDRAWVSEVRASNDGKLAVLVGPTRTVCVKGNVLSASGVNGAEANLQATRNELAKALNAKAGFEPYLKSNDAAVRTWAAGEIKKVDAWIRQYEQDIAQLQAAVATSAPQGRR